MSLPLLLARKREKKMEKLPVRMNSSLVSLRVRWLVWRACMARFSTEVVLKAINSLALLVL